MGDYVVILVTAILGTVHHFTL